MEIAISKLLLFVTVPLLLLAASVTLAATEDLGNGFLHHGVATPVSNHRGIVATVDGEGRNVALIWLFDHRGGYALLMVDAETGETETFPMPFPPGGDCPYSSILSSNNKFYTHFNSYFCEFDPVKREFTFFSKTASQMAMGMTEDDNGVIWSITYPNSGVVSYNPATGEFRDFGYVHKENWPQYQRYMAADDTGWVYFGLGNTASQIVAVNPETGEGTAILPADERGKGNAYVYRDLDGKVYGQSLPGADNPWYELYNGKATKITEHTSHPKPIITSSQGLFHRQFPNGEVLKTCDTVEGVMVVNNPQTGEDRQLKFEYESEGAHIMGLATAPDGTICGGTAFPMRFFSYNPHSDEWVNRAAFGQWNTIYPQGDKFFVGAYSGGYLLEWDPAKPWVPTVAGNADSNPFYHTKCTPPINRPHDLLATSDGKTVIMAGTPGYGYTGGGLLIWDRETNTGEVVEHMDILPDHSTYSIAELPEGRIICGSTTSPGTGGEKLVNLAEMYIFDLATKKVEWHEPLFPGVQSYGDMMTGPNGLVFAFADRMKFFVFDPVAREVIYEADTGAEFGSTNSQQGPRSFVTADDGSIYILFVKGIAQLDPETFEITMVAESPVPIGPGGDYFEGRIYFASGSHVYSYTLPKAQEE